MGYLSVTGRMQKFEKQNMSTVNVDTSYSILIVFSQSILEILI